MSSFWWILFALALYGVVHSFLASLRAKAIAASWFGPATHRWYRLVYSLLGGITFLPVIALYFFLPNRPLYNLPAPWSWLFIFVQLAGAAFFLWSLSVIDLGGFIGLKQLFASSNPDEQDPSSERLVTDGPYRWVRHPLYTASLMLIWFVPFMSLNYLAMCLGITLYLVIGGYFEEKKLVHQFGVDYEHYRRQTPMLIPWPFRRQSDAQNPNL